VPEPERVGIDLLEGLEAPVSAISLSTSKTRASINKSPAEFSEASNIAPASSAPARNSAGHRAEETHRQPSPPDFESVRMDHQPNPYASVPSLYDLYVQAAASNQKIRRFGLDVFRRGVPNPDVLPMDLPVGPDYIVGPGDSLLLNLWGGVSQRLSRTVDREGRASDADPACFRRRFAATPSYRSGLRCRRSRLARWLRRCPLL
jgi:hypothetical protein